MALTAIIKFSADQFPAACRLPVDGIELGERDFCVVVDPRGRGRIGYVLGFESRCRPQLEHLDRIVRRASDEEIGQWHDEQERRLDALAVARARSAERGLQMKFISVNFDDAQNVVLFNFTADRRVDFRELVRDLASHFRARIELWQIGSRQGAADKDGYGICGNRICCATRMQKQYPAVSMRHARDQDLANQTPQKLAGMCGRLRCCLRYEHDCYLKEQAGAPMVGAQVHDGEGREGVVVDRHLLQRRALVKFNGGRGEWVGFEQLRGFDQPAPATEAVEDEVDEMVPE